MPEKITSKALRRRIGSDVKLVDGDGLLIMGKLERDGFGDGFFVHEGDWDENFGVQLPPYGNSYGYHDVNKGDRITVIVGNLGDKRKRHFRTYIFAG